MKWMEILFGIKKQQKPKTLYAYPLKEAIDFGMTFNDWRKKNGFKIEDKSVPEDKLYNYCKDCGWPDKWDWSSLFGKPNLYLDTLEYSLWLKFIGVLDPDRSQQDCKKVAEYIYKLKEKAS
ncbi:MAG: hypothetical protein O9302_00165 [Cyclobacteriaceae bacterium]|jgi:hypothetical protein|nr:hypothetical protein [Cytophagales bacterium]MCZ8326444.1 hypothetical protein [Cyclobacteriaceae bacterium]